MEAIMLIMRAIPAHNNAYNFYRSWWEDLLYKCYYECYIQEYIIDDDYHRNVTNLWISLVICDYLLQFVNVLCICLIMSQTNLYLVFVIFKASWQNFLTILVPKCLHFGCSASKAQEPVVRKIKGRARTLRTFSTFTVGFIKEFTTPKRGIVFLQSVSLLFAGNTSEISETCVKKLFFWGISCISLCLDCMILINGFWKFLQTKFVTI